MTLISRFLVSRFDPNFGRVVRTIGKVKEIKKVSIKLWLNCNQIALD